MTSQDVSRLHLLGAKIGAVLLSTRRIELVSRELTGDEGDPQISGAALSGHEDA